MEGPKQDRNAGRLESRSGGCRVMSLGPEREEREKQASFFILILFAVPAGGRGWPAAKARAAGKWKRMPSRPRSQIGRASGRERV